nr:FxDxF family PEP-CTERM protein [uncultured Sphingomonas sp.]
MKRFLRVMAAATALAFASTASAAIITPGSPPPGVFVVTGDPFTGTSPVTATIGNTPQVGGTTAAPVSFSDSFLFTIGPPGGGLIGTGSGSIITSSSLLFSTTDLDLTSVIVNGVALTISRTADGLIESAGASNVSIFSGQLNNITVTGISRGLGSYGGNLTFTPVAAIPEPGTWALMLLGFGAIGFSMRHRRRVTASLQAV